MAPPSSATSTIGYLSALPDYGARPIQSAARAQNKPPCELSTVIARSEATKQSRAARSSPGLLRFARNDVSIQRLAAVVLDVLPARLDQLHDVRRHRDVVQIGRHLAAVLVRPGKEIERL